MILNKKGVHIMKVYSEFVSNYFNKVFSNELSKENQEFMSDKEKLENLEILYNFAKQR